jgi:hypothetical protein
MNLILCDSHVLSNFTFYCLLLLLTPVQIILAELYNSDISGGKGDEVLIPLIGLKSSFLSPQLLDFARLGVKREFLRKMQVTRFTRRCKLLIFLTDKTLQSRVIAAFVSF